MNDGWRVLLTHTDQDFSVNYETEALRALEKLAEVRRNPLGYHLSSPDLLASADGCQVIITEGKAAIDARALHSLRDLLAVIRCGVELRSIDVEAASREGILVVSIPAKYVTPVVELTVGLMVCLARDLLNRSQGLRGGRAPWSPMGTQLRGRVLGIVGFGDIGRELARVAGALGMRVCFADPYVDSHPFCEKMDLSDLLAVSDFVSVHAKWTPETENMFSEIQLRQMKRSAYFINTSRGALVDEQALERALHEGWIAGAALDVFKNEPIIVGNPLLQLPNLIPTPHIAGFSPETRLAQAWRSVEIVRELQSGTIPANTANASDVRSPRLLTTIKKTGSSENRVGE